MLHYTSMLPSPESEAHVTPCMTQPLLNCRICVGSIVEVENCPSSKQKRTARHMRETMSHTTPTRFASVVRNISNPGGQSVARRPLDHELRTEMWIK